MIAAARFALALLVLAAVLPRPAAAHPHLRFAWQVAPIVEAGALAGLRVAWRMDPLSSMLVARGFDADRDGTLDAAELEALARQNEGLLGESGWFLELTQEGRVLGFRVSAPLRAALGEAGLELSFEVRLAAPATGPLGVRFFDETWYVALGAADPVLAPGAPCRADATTRVLATRGWGEHPVPVVTLNCSSRQPPTEERSR